YSWCKNQTEASAHAETQQLSFAEVMRLIQEGKEVPGVKKLDIQPSNQSPTPSQMVRILKPWETASSSKYSCGEAALSSEVSKAIQPSHPPRDGSTA
uniref:Peroxisomal membrane protein PEX14-like KPWE domain-containing protein n=1 Tax=Amphiprion percula TaxID=161767 RepID=A0A3P8U2R8_AMPPE